MLPHAPTRDGSVQRQAQSSVNMYHVCAMVLTLWRSLSGASCCYSLRDDAWIQRRVLFPLRVLVVPRPARIIASSLCSAVCTKALLECSFVLLIVMLCSDVQLQPRPLRRSAERLRTNANHGREINSLCVRASCSHVCGNGFRRVCAACFAALRRTYLHALDALIARRIGLRLRQGGLRVGRLGWCFLCRTHGFESF